MDIVLIIDKSGSIFDQFPIFKQRLVEIVQDFPVGQDKDRFAAVSFNETASLLFTLDQLNTSAQVASAISSIPGPGGLTNIAGRGACRLLFSVQYVSQ